jgi:hypothetical protein
MVFFSGNVCWWQVRFEKNNCRMVCYKSDENGPPDPTTDPQRSTIHWWDTPVLRPENTMTGVSWRRGAGWWGGGPIIPERRFRGYTVANASHWVFNGTGLANGDTFGAGTSEANTIIGYETDACVPGQDGTPNDFVVLATADLSDWPGSSPAPASFSAADQAAWLNGNFGRPGAATMGIYQRNGTVITAGTSNWAGGLSSAGSWGPVDQITKNILSALCPGATATFVNTDTTTQGNWHGVYGADGYSVANDSKSPPSYAVFAVQNQSNFTWVASTGDPRALQTGSGTGRIAATWYGSAFGFDVNLTDGKVHQFALYATDWDNQGRGERVQIVDANTGKVLDTRDLSNFTNGIYLIWNLSGHVKVKVSLNSGDNAVVSGVFFK